MLLAGFRGRTSLSGRLTLTYAPQSSPEEIQASTRSPLKVTCGDARAVAVGILLGVFCGIANGWPVASTLAQMATPWIGVAAFVAYRAAGSSKQAAMLGAVALLAANVAYFAVGVAARGSSGLPFLGGIGFFALWTTVGLLIGPVTGVFGWRLAEHRTAFTAVVTVATVLMAEPLALWVHVDHFDSHLACLSVAAAGLALPLIWFRRQWRQAAKGVALVLVLAYPAAVILEAALIALRQISAPMRLI
ncbi:MAG: DUF6518 family protein [Acidimicrobiia bacterium]|nr:DUF6518 family protein [Acidimicrobiia bacterium]